MRNKRSSIFCLESSIFNHQTRARWPILWLALQGKGFGQVGNKKPHVLGRVDRDSRHEPPSVRWTLNFKPTVTRERPHQQEQHIRSTMWAINPTSLPRHKMKLSVNTQNSQPVYNARKEVQLASKAGWEQQEGNRTTSHNTKKSLKALQVFKSWCLQISNPQASLLLQREFLKEQTRNSKKTLFNFKWLSRTAHKSNDQE